MNKITTILLIFVVIGLFTTAFMLNEIRTEMHNQEPVVANNTTNGTLNTTVINSTTENITSEPVAEETTAEETTADETNSHEMYKSQFNQKDGEPKGETLNEDYIESTGASNGKELQEYMENNVPDDYK